MGGKQKKSFQSADAWYKPPFEVAKVNTDAAAIHRVEVAWVWGLQYGTTRSC